MKIVAIAFFLILQIPMSACPVCDRAKEKTLFGKISHGVGPQSVWDYASVWITIAIVVVALYFTIRWLIKPKEGNTDHIKYSILTTEQP